LVLITFTCVELTLTSISSPTSPSLSSPPLTLPDITCSQYGLVDNTESERRKAKSQWAGRYNERNPNSTLEGAELAEGEEGDNYIPPRTMDPEEIERRKKAGLWTRDEEEFYGEGE
jgi:hypothetical protein